MTWAVGKDCLWSNLVTQLMERMTRLPQVVLCMPAAEPWHQYLTHVHTHHTTPFTQFVFNVKKKRVKAFKKKRTTSFLERSVLPPLALWYNGFRTCLSLLPLLRTPQGQAGGQYQNHTSKRGDSLFQNDLGPEHRYRPQIPYFNLITDSGSVCNDRIWGAMNQNIFQGRWVIARLGGLCLGS